MKYWALGGMYVVLFFSHHLIFAMKASNSIDINTHQELPNPKPLPTGPLPPSVPPIPTTKVLEKPSSGQESNESSANSQIQSQPLKKKVHEELLKDRKYANILSQVVIEEQNGDIILRGQVASRAEERRLIRRVYRIQGVSRVIDELQVAPRGFERDVE